MTEKYINRLLENLMDEGFGRYAKYIIQDRALPDIRDGLKPVQRRIIYAMNNLKLFYDLPHKKSARTVGEVIGKYHPHGDSSIYEAMVRMSQNWKNNAVLIDMHGNNGSIDGDGPAAMRYTECRLSQFGQTMVDGLDKNTVSFINNFDDSEQEPTVLPTLLPNLLINGANGIAAGYATNIPTFNVSEVINAIITRIDSPNCHLQSIMNVMPGPDFPTAGIILNPKGIEDAYKNGKGKIIIRGKIEQIDKKTIKISSIPYDTNKSQIVRQIDVLAQKYDSLKINEVRDESDKNGVSIILEIARDANLDLIKNLIYKETQLQISYMINNVAIINHHPVQFPILLALDTFIEHINTVVINAAKFDLQKALKRKEIVEGLIKAISIIDDVIELIRHASNKDEAKKQIIDRLFFTENQAEAIVNLRLYRLSNTDVTALKNELEELIQQINDLNLIINNKTIRDNHIKNELREYKKLFGHERLTEIVNDDGQIQISESDKIEDKEVVISVSYDGYLKLLSKQSFSSVDYKTINIKSGDIPVALFNSNMKHKVILITSKGNYVTIPTYKIEQAKWKDVGVHVNSIVNLSSNEKIIFAFNYANETQDHRSILLASKNNKVKRIDVSDLNVGKIAKVATCFNLDDNDKLVSAWFANDNGIVAFISSDGYAYKCNINEISVLGRGAAGVKAMKLHDNCYLAGTAIAKNNNDVLLVASNGMKRIHFSDISMSKRPSSGNMMIANTKTNPTMIFYVDHLGSTDLIQYVDDSNQLKFIKASEVGIGDNSTRIRKISDGKLLLANVFEYVTKTSIFDEEDSLVDKNEGINNLEEESKNNEEQVSLFDDEDK